MSRTMLVMVVEDHDVLRDATVNLLRQEGYEAFGVASAEEVNDNPLPRTPDLYVIDLNLPGEDGVSLARRLRKAQPLAGIVMTTARTQLNDRLVGYAVGADIYLPKPVDPQEFLAALSALSKRLTREALAGGLALEFDKCWLRGPGGESKLSEAEARLLVAFATAPEQTLERWQVAVQLNPAKEEISADNLQNRLSLLRKKIAACGIEGDSVRALRGTGYRLCVPLVVV